MSRSKYGAINVQPSRCTVWDGIKTIDRTVIFIYDDTVIFGGYVIGLPLGLVYANAMEWGIHKYILHGRKLGKKRGTFWSFHFHRHHRQSRQNAFHDPDYREPLGQSWNGQAKEAAALVALSIAHLPLAPIAPIFTATIVYSAIDYYRKHKRAHLDPEWAREHLPWHVDHHMALNQDA
ncbi:MAG: hypothetical protein ACJARS_002755, partial [bacterium]